MSLDSQEREALRHPLTALGIPHLYVSYAGYLCYAFRRRRMWHTGVLCRHRVWRER